MARTVEWELKMKECDRLRESGRGQMRRNEKTESELDVTEREWGRLSSPVLPHLPAVPTVVRSRCSCAA